MYLRRVFTTVYVGKTSRTIDTHKHYVEGAGYSEHSVFIDLLQTPEELEPIGRGPKNKDRRPQHVKAKAKASQETLDLIRTPSGRGSALPLANRPEVTNAGESAPVVSGELRPEVSTDNKPERSEGSVAAAPNSIKCMARVWGGGAGGQCKLNRLDDRDYCRGHFEDSRRPHGRIDGEIPENKRHKMKGCSGAATSDACSTGTAPSIPVSLKRKHEKTCSGDQTIRSGRGQSISAWRKCNEKSKRDIVLLRAMQAAQQRLDERRWEKDEVMATAESLKVLIPY